MAKKIMYDLLKLGLTEGEAKVYLALTELGASSVGPIVKKAQIAASNSYDILNRLIDKGLISYISKSKVKYYQAASPRMLLEFLNKKEQEINEQKSMLKNVVPSLEKLQQVVPSEKAEIFSGKKGLKAAYEKLMVKKSKSSECLFFYLHKKRYAKESDLFYFSVVDILKRVPVRSISNEFARSSPWFKKTSKWMNHRYVDFPLPGHIEVCNDLVLHVSWEEKITAVLIQSSDIANNMRDYFNETWKVAKK